MRGILAILILQSSLLQAVWAQEAPWVLQEGIHAHKLKVEDGRIYNLMLYLPKAHAGKSLPMIVFLHGSGERGDDPQVLLRWPLLSYLVKRDDFPFIVAAPQLGADEVWGKEHVLPLVDALLRQPLPLDRARVSLTGLSMGGGATWQAGLAAPGRFAALVPIASKGILSEPCRLAATPVWAFHNEGDKRSEVSSVQNAIKQLDVCGNKARLTVYARNGHNAWSEAYADPALFDWLQQQRLKP